ncbi:MAG: hypothetical protein IJ438_08905 [Clostridia bacterium]|nr:hypothetical protein [Clostridia bacterium]
MNSAALIKLLGHYWDHESLAFWEKTEEDRIIEDESGLSIRLTGRSVSFTGIPGEGIHLPMIDQEKCTFFLSRTKWDALVRYVQDSGYRNEDAAKVYLLNRIMEACYVKPRRSNNSVMIVLFAMLVIMLMLALIAWEPVRPALVVLAALLLGGAVLLLGFGGRGKESKAISIFTDCVSSEVDKALMEALAALEKPDISSAKGWIATGMLAACAACAYIAMQPEYFLMFPSQRVDYFFSEYIHGYIDEAEDALMWMTSGKAKNVLMEKIDEGDDYNRIHAAQLAVRLHENGRFSREEAREIALRSFNSIALAPKSTKLIYRLDELEEIMTVCTPEDMCGFVQKLSGEESINNNVLRILGAGTMNAPIEDRMDCYDALVKNGHDGAIYLNSALEKVETAQAAKDLLLQMPEQYLTAMAEAWSKNFTTLDGTLEYLHMLASIGVRLGEDFTKPVEFTTEFAGEFALDMGKFRISAETENRLPEGEYTILPVLRTEDRESIGGYFMEDGTSYDDLTRMPSYNVHDEDDKKYQSLELLPQVLSMLPAERIPCSVEEADLILLFDQQYNLESSVELEAYDFMSSRGVRHKPIFQAVQRLSVYDAKTGARLLMINERLEMPPEMSDSVKNKVYREKLKESIANSTGVYFFVDEDDMLDDKVYSSISRYLIVNFSKLWVDQQLALVCGTLQSSGGDLSAFLPSGNE